MFDKLADPTLPEAGRAWRLDRGIRDEEILVFWAEQPEPLQPELPRRVRSELARVCQANGWRLVVRLHPSSTDEKKERIPKGCIQSFAHEPLHALIFACDVGVTLTSTVGWELLLADKPLLAINISAFSYAVTYGVNDGAFAIDRLEDAERGLRILLGDGGISHQLSELRRALPKPGGAADRVCDLIEMVAQYPGQEGFNVARRTINGFNT